MRAQNCGLPVTDLVRGQDRFREEMGDEYHIADGRDVARVFLGAGLPRSAARLSTGLSWRRRQGEAEELSAHYLDRRFELHLQLPF